MNQMLFLMVCSLLTVLYMVISWYVSSRITTNDDYFLAGRTVGFCATTFTLIATHLGGGVLAGSAQEGYLHGYHGFWYGLGISCGLLLLGFGFAAKLRAFNIATTVELFERKYGSVFLKKIASLLMIFSLSFILIGQCISTRGLLHGLGIEYEWAMILLWFCMVLYTMVGGFRAVVLTDILQVGFIIVTFLGVFAYFLFQEPSYFFSWSYLRGAQATFDVQQINFSAMLNLFLMPIFFNMVEQDMAQRFFAARTKHIAAYAAIAAAICIILFLAVPVYFGMKARLMGVAVSPVANPLIACINSFGNDWITLLVSCGVLAAITSTADSLMCAISSNIVQDFNLELFSGRYALLFSRVITFAIGMFALAGGYYFTNILDLVAQSYELTVSGIFVPLVICFFKKKDFNAWAAGGAMCAGILAFICFRVWYVPAFRGLAAVGVSLCGYVLGLLLWRLRKSICQP